MTAAHLRALLARLLRDILDLTLQEGVVTFDHKSIRYEHGSHKFLITIEKVENA